MQVGVPCSEGIDCPHEFLQQAEIVKKMLESYAWYEDLSAVELLENFVALELQYPALYDINVNLAILKHYLMFKSNTKSHIIQNVLIQAIMHLPSPDFDLCLCQIPLHNQTSDPIISALIEMESLLQTCRFPTFWTTLESSRYLCGISKVPDFKNAIRRFMAGVISLTYHTITLEDARCLLHLETVAEFTSFCSEQLKGQWICDTKTGLVTIQKAENSVAILGDQNLVDSPPISESVLQQCLAAINGGSSNAQVV